MLQSTSMSSGLGLQIMPHNQKVVNVGGKQYNVKTVSDPLTCDGTKEVVVVDGKQYNVKTVPDFLACDKTKDVVIINGKTHTVHDKNSIQGFLSGIGKLNVSA